MKPKETTRPPRSSVINQFLAANSLVSSASTRLIRRVVGNHQPLAGAGRMRERRHPSGHLTRASTSCARSRRPTLGVANFGISLLTLISWLRHSRFLAVISAFASPFAPP